MQQKSLSKSSPPSRKKLLVETLEQRILYSADTGAIFADLQEAPIEAEVRVIAPIQTQQTNTENQTQSIQQRHEIVFIDESVEGYEVLINDLLSNGDDRTFEIYTIHGDDGIDQITSTLAGIDDVNAIHIITHGDAGQIQIGDATINNETFEQFSQSVSNWSDALNSEADILFYGCNVAATADGQQLLAKIAEATGADIAASTDLTGNVDAGGDWVLESNIGHLETASITNVNWQGTLALTAEGGETLVNQTTVGIQEIPEFAGGKQVATDANGNFVAIWVSDDASGTGIYGRLYDANGVAQSNEFLINTYTTSTQSNPSVAMDANGNFVVTWESNGQDGSGNGIFAQRFNAAGVAQGAEFQVNTNTAFNQIQSAIAMDSNGNFVITWQSDFQDGSGFGVYAQRFDAAGVAQGAEFQVNTYTASYQQQPDIAMDANGNFVIAWQSYDQDSSFEGIYAQRYDAAGVAQGDEFQVNTYLSFNQQNPAIAMDANGNFVVAWESEFSDSDGYGISAQRYNAAGVAQGSEFLVNTYTFSNQTAPAIAMDADGNFVVTWESALRDGDGDGISVRLYNAAGVAQGPEFLVNTSLGSNQEYSGVSWNGDNIIVIWSGNGTQSGNVDSQGVFFQRYRIETIVQAVGDSVTTNEDTPVVIDPTANDTDTENDTINIVEFTQASNGTVVDNGDGTLTYTPNANYSGSDAFEYVAIDSGSGLQHYWGLDGNATDSVGGANGTLTGTTTVAGDFGNGLNFNETSNLVTLPDITYNSEFTISLEFKVTENNGNLFQRLYTHGDIESTNSIGIFLTENAHPTNPSVISAVVRDGNDTKDNYALQVDISPSGLNLIDGQFHTYTLTVSREGVNVYIDGVLAATDTTRGTEGVNPTGNVYLGARQDFANDRYFGGDLDTVQIYDNALGSDQIANLDAKANRATVNLTVTPVNDEQVLATNTGATVAEGSIGNIITTAMLQTTDVDNTAAQITYTVDAAPSNGTLYLNGVVLNATDTFTQDDINNNLITYTHDGTDTTLDSFNFTVDDGAGTTTSSTFNWTVTPTIDLIQTLPSTQTVNEDNVLTFNTANDNAITVDDTVAGSNSMLQVSFSVNDGVLNLASVTGITFVEGAQGTSTFIIQGTESDLNAAFEGMTFTPNANFNGSVTLNMQTAISADLVGHYTFEGGNANDQSAGVAYNGSLNGDATIVTDAERGEVLSLGGAGSVSISSMYGNPSNVTLAAWVNLNTADTSGAELISLGDNVVIRLDETNSNGITGFYYNGTNWVGVTATGTNIAGDGWHHLAFVFDDANDQVSLFLDGNLVAQSTTTDTIAYTNGTETFIGKHGNTLNNFDLNGMIDDARIYTRALSAVEISSLANETNSVSSTIAITVNQVNDAGTFGGDVSATANEDTGTSGTVTFSDAADGYSVNNFAINSAASNGTAAIDAAGNWTYTPNVNFNGSDAFTVQVTDDDGNVETQVISITVTPVNDNVQAVGDSVTTTEDTPVVVDPTANDTDMENDTINIVEFTQASNGTVVDNGDGTLTYTPNANYSGSDAFEYVAIDSGSGLQHYWGLDGNATDSVGGADGTLTGTTTVAGDFGDGLNFNETSDYVTLPDITYNSEFTISLEFKVTEINGSLFQYLYSHGDIDSTNSINIYLVEDTHPSDPNMIRTVVRDGNDTKDEFALQVDISPSGLNLIDGQFHTYTLTVSSGGLNVYIDGVLAATDATRGTEGVNPTGDVYLGARQDLNVDRFFGGDLDTVQIFDNALSSDQIADLDTKANRSTVNLTVTQVNDAGSFGGNLTANTNEDTSTAGTAVFNDNADGYTSNTFALQTAASSGTATIDAAGNWTYTPNANFNGTDSFTVQVTDDDGNVETQVISITVNAVTDLTAADDSDTIAEDTLLSSNVSANDSTTSGGTLTYAVTSGVSNGTLNFNADGTYTYQGNSNFNGTDSFTYTVTDADSGESATQTVTLTVSQVDDIGSFGGNLLATTFEDTATSGTMTYTDTADGYTSDNFTLIAQASNGTAAIDAAGNWTYTPNANYIGSDSFTVKVTDDDGNNHAFAVSINVIQANDPGTFGGDVSATTNEDTGTSGTVTFTDAVDGYSVNNFAINTAATNGTAAIDAAGNWTYTPNANFNGSDSFTVQVTDDDGNVETQVISITVTQVNDAGTFGGDISATTNEDTDTSGTVTFTDTADGFTTPNFSINTAATNGTATIDAAGNWTYTPSANFNGSDSFIVQVTDDDGNVETQVISITVSAVTDLTAADDSATIAEDTLLSSNVSANDSTTSGGVLTYAVASGVSNGTLNFNADGTYTYQGNSNFNGSDSFTYTVTDADSGESATQTVTLTITQVNDAGTFGGVVSAIINEDTATSGTVTFTDAADGYTGSTFAVQTAASNGTAAIDSAGNWTYTPNANFNGSDTFIVQVTDDDGNVEFETISITVTQVNDAGTFSGDVSATTNEDTGTSGTVTFTDAADGFTTPNFSINTAATNGTATIDAAGNWTYTPSANFNGSDSFTVQVTDDDGNVETQVISITVTQINDTGTFGGDLTATTNEDTATSGTVTFSDTADGFTTPNFSVQTNAANGTATIDAAGNWTYTPSANFNGGDSFTVQVTDDDGNVETQIISVTITAANDAPTITSSGPAQTFNENSQPVTIDSGITVSDVDMLDFDGATLTVSITNNGTSNDQLVVEYSLSNVRIRGNELYYGPNIIGIVSGGNGVGDPLVITFNANADLTAVQYTARQIQYTNYSDDPSNLDREISFVLTDGDGGTSSTATQTVHVAPTNDAPIIATDLYTENFEGGATGWSTNETNSSAQLSEYLSRPSSNTVNDGSQVLSKTFSVLDNTNTLVVSFDFYEIDSWDTEEFRVFVNDVQILSETFKQNLNESSTAGTTGNVSWTITPVSSGYGDLTDNSIFSDQIHHIELTITNPGTSFKLGFGSSLNQSQPDEFYGIDNLSIASFGNTITYTENSGAVTFLPASTIVADVDNAQLQSAVIQISNNYTSGEDTLAFTNQNGIVGTWDAGTGTLSLTGNASKADYEAAIESITYENSSDSPNTLDRTVSITINDGSDDSDTLTSTIQINQTNDPGIFGGNVSATTNEDTATSGTVTFTDTDDGFTTPNFSINTAATNGTATIDAAGNWTYTPSANFNGSDSFTVQVTDDDGNVETQVINITVTQVNDAGTFGGDVSATTNEDTVTSGAVTFTDTADGFTTPNFTINTAATNGTAAIDAAGNWTYTPSANFNGSDSFTVQVTDDDGNVETKVINITVNQVNDAGTFGGDVSATTNEDTATSGTVTFTDAADGFTTPNFSINTAATNGTATIDAAGNWTYTPSANFNGSDSFTVQVTDDDGNVETQVISITVNQVNNPGTFGGDLIGTTNEDIGTSGTVTFSDAVDGFTTPNFSVQTNASNGTATIDAAGNWTYTPNANYNGSDSFIVQVTDDDGNVETETVNITVTQVNDAGTFGGDVSATTNEDTAASGTVTFTDTADGFTTPNFSINTAATNGTAAIDAAGNWTYTPSANFNGADSFTVQVTDDDGNVEFETISITVTQVNDAGTFGGNLTATTNEDTVTSGTVTFTDTADGFTTPNFSINTAATNGTATIDAAGNWTYTPSANFNGSDSFTVQVTDDDGNVETQVISINVTQINDAGTFGGDVSATTNEDTATSGTVTFTDAADGYTGSTFAVQTAASNGTAAIDGVGNWTYTPNANFNGSDTFIVQVTDDDGNVEFETISITVTQVNDAGTFGGNLTATTNEDTATSGTVTFTDTADGFTTPNFSINTAATNGTAAIDAAGNWTYTPNANYNGSDSFIVQVTDDDGNVETETVNITVTQVNDAGTFGGDVSATTNEDTATSGTVTFTDAADGFTTPNFSINTAATNGTATIDAAGNWTYTPSANFNGSDSFTVQVTDDDGNVETQVINITVNQVNDAGTFGGNLTATTNEDTATSGTVTFTDTADGFTTPNFSINTAATNGTAAIDAAGNWTYTPSANFNGSDSFTVQVTDDDGNVETQVITVTVNQVNDAGSFGGNLTGTTNEDTATSGTVTFSDATDGYSVNNFAINTAATNGTATIDAAGNWTYTPNANFNGADSFTVQVTDDDGNVETQVISINVIQINDAGTFSGDVSATTNEDTATSGTVNFTDTADGFTTPNFSINTAATNGTATIDAAGNWTYTPSANFNGSDSFTVQVTDDDGNVETQVISINVTQINDAGTFGGDVSATTNEDTATSGTVTFTDAADGYTGSTFAVQTAASNGTATIDGVGNWTYTPNANFNGSDTFIVQVTDDDGNVEFETISITVTQVNDAGIFGGDVSATTNEDTATSGTVTFADAVDGYSVNNFAINSAAANGVATIDAAGNWSYTPSANFNGSDSFTVQVTDDAGNVETQVINITVNQVNDAGTFGGDVSATTNEDTATSGTITFTDAADGYTGSTFAINSGASNGTASINNTGNWTYTPTANFSGIDNFTVKVTDDDGNIETKTVKIAVQPADGTVLIDPGTGLTPTSEEPETEAPLDREIQAVLFNISNSHYFTSDISISVPETVKAELTKMVNNFVLREFSAKADYQFEPQLIAKSLRYELSKVIYENIQYDFSLKNQIHDDIDLLTIDDFKYEEISERIQFSSNGDSLKVAGSVLSASALWWALRATGLLASLISSIPIWRQVDLLAILPDADSEEPTAIEENNT